MSNKLTPEVVESYLKELNFTPEEIALYETWPVTFDKKEAPERFLFEWQGHHFIQLGKLNGITATGLAKVAAGKSMLCNLMMAASLCGEIWDVHEPAHKLKCLVKNCKSLYIDVEMGRGSTYSALFRIKMICESYNVHVPHCYKMRTRSVSVEAPTIDEILRGIQFHILKELPDVVYIDNMVFVLDNMDVNGPLSALRIAQIDSWCKKYNTTIVLVAHGNKSAEDVNIAGTAGTMVSRISSYILAIEPGDIEHPNEWKKVITQKARQGGFPDDMPLPFHFLPFTCEGVNSVYPVLGQCLNDPKDWLVELFDSLFDGRESLSYTDMCKGIIEKRGVQERESKGIISEAIRTQVITKTGTGKRDPYKLTKSLKGATKGT